MKNDMTALFMKLYELAFGFEPVELVSRLTHDQIESQVNGLKQELFA